MHCMSFYILLRQEENLNVLLRTKLGSIASYTREVVDIINDTFSIRKGT